MSFGKLNFSTSFNPTAAFPLDARTYFESLEEAEIVARTAKEVGSTESVYYIGQILTVVEGDAATLYIIQPDLSLMKVGTGVVTPGGDSPVLTEISWDDIKNKPFGNTGWIIDWDGTPTEESVEISGLGGFIYKVGNPIKKENLLGCSVKLSIESGETIGLNGVETLEIEISEENIMEFNEDCFMVFSTEYSVGALLVSFGATTVTSAEPSFEIPSAGLWFVLAEGVYRSVSLQSSDYGIKKLDDKFINHDWSAVGNKPFYEKGFHIEYDGTPTSVSTKGILGNYVSWDGNPTEVFIEVPEDAENGVPHIFFYKVAESVEEPITYYEFRYQFGSEESSETISSGDFIVERDENGELLYSAQQNFWVVNFNKAGTYNVLGFVTVDVQEPGLYFIYGENVGGNLLKGVSLKSSDYQEFPFYKVSEPIDSIENAYLSVLMEGSLENIQLNEDYMAGITTTPSGNSYPPESPFVFNIVAPEDILYSIDSSPYKISFQETGLYFLSLVDMGARALTTLDYEIKPLEEKFIPESIARKDRVPEAYEIGTRVDWELPSDTTSEDVLVDIGAFGDIDSALYIKVSEPVKENIVGWSCTLKSTSDNSIMESSEPITEDMGAQSYESGSSTIVYVTNVVTPETLRLDAIGKDITFPEAGLYFLVVADEFYIGNVFSPNYEVIKIDPKFLPELSKTDTPVEIGCPILNPGILQRTSGNYTVIDLYSIVASSQDYNNLNYSKGAYPKYDNFIISFYSQESVNLEEGSSKITIYIATGYASSGVTSSFPITLDCKFLEAGLMYTIRVLKSASGVYEGLFIDRPTNNIVDDEEHQRTLPTTYAICRYIENLGLMKPVDEVPTESSENFVKSGGVYSAIEDKANKLIKRLEIQSDNAEVDPRSPSYIKNKIVYDEPMFENLYLESLPEGSVTPNTSISSLNCQGYYTKVADIPSEDSMDLLSYIREIRTVKMQELLDSEVLEVVEISTTCVAIKGTLSITDYLVIAVSAANYYPDTHVRFFEPGLYILCCSNTEGNYVDTLTFNTKPHKLPNEYLNIEEVPTEDSKNPISSGAVYRAIQEGKGDLQFDDTPTEGSSNLLTSGSVYKAFSDVKKSIESDAAPTEGSEKLVKSGGVYSAIENVKTDINASLQGKANQSDVESSLESINSELSKKVTQTEIDTAISPLQTAIDGKANQSDVYTKTEVYTKSDVYTKTEVYTKSDVYNKSEVDTSIENINFEIDKKANQDNVYTKSDVYTKSEVDTALANRDTEIDKKANQDNVYTKSDVYTKSEVYSKSEIDGKLTGAFHYLGTKENYSELPTENNELGDTWNILNADPGNNIKAGDNVAWNGDSWDVLSGIVDLSEYAKKEDLDKKVSKEEGYSLISDEELRKLSTIAEGANNYVHPTKHSISEISDLEDNLKSKVSTNLLGVPKGVSTLDEEGKIPESQIPSSVKDPIIYGYYQDSGGKFYEESTFTTLITGVLNKLYLCMSKSKLYRYDGTSYIALASGGTTSDYLTDEEYEKIMSEVGL